MKKIFSTLAGCTFALALSYAQGAPAIHDEHDHAHAPHDRVRQNTASRSRRRASKARRRSARRAPVSYVCPMHPDVRSRSRGECPKCGMTLVAPGRKATVAGGTGDKGASEGHSNP